MTKPPRPNSIHCLVDHEGSDTSDERQKPDEQCGLAAQVVQSALDVHGLASVQLPPQQIWPLVQSEFLVQALPVDVLPGAPGL